MYSFVYFLNASLPHKFQGVSDHLCSPTAVEMHCLTFGIHSDACIIRHFHPCAIMIACTYTNLNSVCVCMSPTIYLGYMVYPIVPDCTPVLNASGSYSTITNISCLNICKHREGTAQIHYKRFLKPSVELIGLEVALGESLGRLRVH